VKAASAAASAAAAAAADRTMLSKAAEQYITHSE